MRLIHIYLIFALSITNPALATERTDQSIEKQDRIVLSAEDELRLPPLKAMIVPLNTYIPPRVDIGGINIEMLESEFATENEFRGFREDHSWQRDILEYNTAILYEARRIRISKENDYNKKENNQ